MWYKAPGDRLNSTLQAMSNTINFSIINADLKQLICLGNNHNNNISYLWASVCSKFICSRFILLLDFVFAVEERLNLNDILTCWSLSAIFIFLFLCREQADVCPVADCQLCLFQLPLCMLSFMMLLLVSQPSAGNYSVEFWLCQEHMEMYHNLDTFILLKCKENTFTEKGQQWLFKRENSSSLSPEGKTYIQAF